MMALKWYLIFAGCSTAVLACLLLLNQLAIRQNQKGSHRIAYLANYLLLVLTACSALWFQFHKDPLDMLAVQVEAKALWADLAGPSATVVHQSVMTLAEAPIEPLAVGVWLSYLVLWVLVIGALFFFFRDLGQFFSLRRLVHEAVPIKQIGKVCLAISEVAEGAFSWRGSGKAWIILPSRFLSYSTLMRHAVRHELGHHRAGDTTLCYLDRLVLYALWWNPLSHFWIQSLNDLREFRCDAAIVNRDGRERDQYCESLLQAASFGVSAHRHSLGMAGPPESILSRRIRTMVNDSNNACWRVSSIYAVMGLAFTVVLGVGFVASAAVDQSKFDSSIASQLQHSFNGKAQVQIDINDQVMSYLEKYIGTSEGRVHVKKSIERFQVHRQAILPALKKYNMPSEILAVALIESGFVNFPQAETGMKAAGMWQFIPSTARIYNLTVDQGVDERLNVPLASDAAMRYLKSLHLRFQSWPLAILAYNAGETRIQKGINATGSRDPWVVVEAGYGGDPGYLAKYMAGALALHYFEVL